MSIEYHLQENGEIISSELDINHFFNFEGERFVPGKVISNYLRGKGCESVRDRFYRAVEKGSNIVLKPLVERKDVELSDKDVELSDRVKERFRKLMIQRGYEENIGSIWVPSTPLSELTGEI